MIFERLRIHGFKSFCEATDLVLEPGLTGVVGPNGCGKSNLVEAMRWVMGESSYKAMRASGMDDVIFSGSGNRAGRNSAEVTLVLDNSDRTAPAALNTADKLEVTRRIERAQGSVYRVNGREVRARDVQLLFADASTGAHSPALVRQGQIGELISAKPVKRRALLEEAAGISGLHSRRHEAELRLRAAEQNLERVDDIVAQVEGQLETLKRQARLAVRYRSVSGDIRKAEAALYHVRWVAARVVEKETEALQGQLVSKLADAMHEDRVAQSALEDSNAALQPLRESEAAAGAIVQRLKILREQLEEEIRRADVQKAELSDRQVQIETDLAREQQQLDEGQSFIDTYAKELAELVAQDEAQTSQEADAKKAVDAAKDALLGVEAKYRRATEEFAQLRARRNQAERGIADAALRIERLDAQIKSVADDAKTIAHDLESDNQIAARRQALDGAQAASQNAENASLSSEAQTANVQAEIEHIRPLVAQAEAELTRLQSEADTLARVLNVGDGGLWPPIVDMLSVQSGYETALGAALGDDLEASADSGAPLYWSGLEIGDHASSLPKGATPISQFVSGAPALNVALSHIGVVAAEQGGDIAKNLRPGQTLVSVEGDVWRWDGLVAKSDAPSAAAQRLSQRNRLADLDRELAENKGKVDALHAQEKTLLAKHDAAQNEERAARQAWREAQKSISVAQSQLDIAQKAIGDLASRKSALEEARVRLTSSLEEAVAIKKDAEESLASLEGLDVAQLGVDAFAVELNKSRESAEQKRVHLSNFESARQMRANRMSQLQSEIGNWQRRCESAEQQKSALSARAAQIVEQLSALSDTPDSHAAKRADLDEQLEEARFAHQRAADKLATFENDHRDKDKASRASNAKLAEVRAEMARVDERLKGLMGRRKQIEQTILETLSVRAEDTAKLADIRPESQLPQEDMLERKVERLKAERERLGGVNLSAEKEMRDVKEKLETMEMDRDDLIAAIAKLRSGISSLNREGRQRLNEAFDKVNAHFSDLFTSLFGGGTAELTFVESDDPLEAGLEIVARPPGKKPQVLTLLSGGEQALTAMALIFAVFLTNPAPICVLDEVDAPLDDANVERFCDLLDSMRDRTDTRFVVITHNPITMARVDRLFGVTMAERGVSQLVSVDLTTAQAVREAS